MRKLILAPVFAAFLVCGSVAPATAQEDKGADELAVEGLKKLMAALSVFIDAIPQYETPEILDNGDIIIRRKPKSGDDEDEGEKPKVEETAT